MRGCVSITTADVKPRQRDAEAEIGNHSRPAQLFLNADAVHEHADEDERQLWQQSPKPVFGLSDTTTTLLPKSHGPICEVAAGCNLARSETILVVSGANKRI